MLSFVLFVTMCALARASSSLSLGPTYHPAHTEVRDVLCYVGDNAPAELPQVSVFAERTGKWRRNKDPSDSPAEYYCDQMAPNRVNGEQTNCAYTEAENNIVHLTTSGEGDANLANEYQVTCSFVVIIVEECPVVEDASGDSSEDSDNDSDSGSGSGSGSGNGNGNGNGSGSDSDSDSSDGYHGRDYRFGGRFWAWVSWSWPGKGSSPSHGNQHKRQDDFVTCESRTSVGACLNSCDPSVPTGGCECLFDLPLGGNLTAEGDCPPGVQCCWNLPCSAHSGQFGGNELQCTLRGGGEETDDGLVPNNCEFSPDGECTCVDPKTETEDASSAPFDCDCNSLSVEEWLEQGAQGTCPAFGTGGGDSETDPDTDADGALAAAKVALDVALRIGSENVLQFLASCDVEILRVEGSETSRICERIFRAFNRNQVRAYRRATKNGCDFVLYPGHAPAARLVAEDALTAEDVAQLDTFTVITDAIEDSASPLAAAAGLAVAVGAATL